jgi:hypothetical protein
MSDTAGGTLHGRDPKQSGAVTAAGAAFILLTLLAIRRFTNINLALPLETHFKLIPSYGLNLASFLIFAVAALATILRWKRWRIWDHLNRAVRVDHRLKIKNRAAPAVKAGGGRRLARVLNIGVFE